VDTRVSSFAILIAVVVFVFLIVLAVASYFRAGNTTRPPSVLGSLWNSLDLEFADRNTTRTLRLLVMVMIVFGIMIVTWATGAGVMRTIWLHGDPSGSEWVKDINLRQQLFSPETSLFLVTEIMRAVGAMLALCLTGGFAGAALGFLFGLPRPPRDSDRPPEAAAKQEAGGGVHDSKHRWRLNSNLLNISDWLTTAIVGVGLVEARGAATWLGEVTNSAAQWLFAYRHGSPVMIPAAIVGGAFSGFPFFYLYTQLIVSGLIAQADLGLKRVPSPIAGSTLRGIKSIRQGLVPWISRSRHAPNPADQPTIQEIQAALEYADIQFSDLLDLSPEDVRSWVRAKAVLNAYQEAAKGIIHLLGRAHNE